MRASWARSALAALATAVACAGCAGPRDNVDVANGSIGAVGDDHGRAASDTGPPELPRASVDTRSTTTAGSGRRLIVHAGGNLQRALDDATPGDVILLEAGAAFVGTFTLPKKDGAAWITIRSAAADAELPAEGSRVTPAFAPRLAKLVTANDDPALRAASGAHHYRLIGLEITAAPTVARTDALVELGAGRRVQRARDDVPHHIILDRSYIHGHATLRTKRCVVMNSAFTAIIDSYLSDCHDSDFDSQAIAGWNGPGPFKIVNDYLEGAGENVMFGGGDPGIRGLVPSDIEIRRNHFYKPMSWKGVWRVKNLLELKNARRVLIEGNVFENCWAAAQAGFALVMKSENQDGGAPWSVTRDVTVRYNKVLNSAGGIDIMGTGTNIDEPANTILIEHNLFRIGGSELGDLGRIWQLVEDPSNITFAHNTGFAPNAILVLDVRQKTFVTLRDNVVGGGRYGLIGSDEGEGKAAIDFYLPHSVITGNVFIGAQATAYPSGNFFSATTADVGFVDFTNADFRLSSRSPFARLGGEGRNPGADIEALNRATSGVVAR